MTVTEVTSQPTDAERFGHIPQVQRAAYLRDGAPSLAAWRSDLHKFKAALIARRSAIEEAINTDFGHRSRHETAMMEFVGVVQGVDYLQRNLRRFMRPATLRRLPFGMARGRRSIAGFLATCPAVIDARCSTCTVITGSFAVQLSGALQPRCGCQRGR